MNDSKKKLFDKAAQRKFLKVYSCALLLPTLVLFGIAYFPLIHHYVAAYSGSVAFSRWDNAWLFTAVLWIFIMAWVPLIIFGIIKLLYQSKLEVLPRFEILMQLFLSSMISGSMLFGALTAISDPGDWALISALLFVPLTALAILSFVVGAMGTAASQVRLYKSSVFQVIPLIAVILAGMIYAASQPAYKYMQEVYEKNGELQYQKDISH